METGRAMFSVPVAIGQTWVHVGADGVPATGLRVEVVGRSEKGWVCIYPDTPEKGTRQLPGWISHVQELPLGTGMRAKPRVQRPVIAASRTRRYGVTSVLGVSGPHPSTGPVAVRVVPRSGGSPGTVKAVGVSEARDSLLAGRDWRASR